MFGCDDCNSSFLETAGISSFLARSFLVGASENCVCVSLSELALIVGTFGASALPPSSVFVGSDWGASALLPSSAFDG